MPEPVPPGSVAEQRRRFDAERSGAPFLIYRDDVGQQQILMLDSSCDRVTVGRGSDADICLSADREVSRLHAQFDRWGQEWVVIDDGLSRNGTFVNGERITGRRRLRDGDIIRVGASTITFSGAVQAIAHTTRIATEIPSLPSLSDGQRKVLVALCRPYKHAAPYATPATNQAIADELFLSVDTVKTHLRALFDKFKVGPLAQNQKRAKLVETVMRLGVVTDRDL